MKFSKKRYIAFTMILVVVVATFCLPVSVAEARIQNISITKLIDEPHYKETFFVITTSENTYHILVTANITVLGNETLIDLTATLINPHNATIVASARVPDTLTDAPYLDESVEAFPIHFVDWVVDALKAALSVVTVVVLIIQVYMILERIIEDVLEAILDIVFFGNFIYASLPWVLLTLLTDTNPDGSFDLYIPYSPLRDHLLLLWEEHYFVATSLSWWEIVKHVVYAPFFNWIKLFTWYSAQLYCNRTALPSPKIAPQASFEWFPILPVVGTPINFTSTSFDPDGYIVETRWQFGDQNESVGNITSHVYENVGCYVVILNVTDNDSLTSIVNQTIQVQSPREAELRLIPYFLGLEANIGCDVTTSFIALDLLNHMNLQNVTFQATDLENLWGDTLSSENVTFDKNGIIIVKGTYTNISVTFHIPQDLSTGWYTGNITATSENGGNATIFVEIVVFAFVHDVAVIDVTTESDWLYQGQLYYSNINVTAVNEGDIPESFNVTLYADSNITIIGDEYTIGVQRITLVNGSSTVLTFPWNTTLVTPCRNYTITAVASVVTYENDTADNIVSSSITLKVRFLGDVNGDDQINIIDIAIAAKAYGSYPSHPRWNPATDVNQDNKINILDLATIARNFGKACTN